MKFSKLNLSKETLQAIEAMKFNTMTPIQEKAIPILLEGSDIIGQADTGTGKTAAFAIPTIESLNSESKEIQALVMCPTRELCCQVAKQFDEMMKYHQGLKCVSIYGGQKIEIQLRALRKKPQVIVGTPGRLLDHVRRGSIKLRSVQTVILDEADLMLGMGFKDDIESILKNTNSREQTILFSATMQKDILQLARKHQKKAKHINVKKKEEQKAKIRQTYYKVNHKLKLEAIKRLLYFHNVKSALIFCNTRAQVDQLFTTLKDEGFSAAKLHGELKQSRRDAVMQRFRDGDTRILIATDVAARGIHVNDIDAVFNYNIPRDSEDYVHRIGRTGRAGSEGLAFSFINSKELAPLKRIASKHKFIMKQESIPTMKELDFSSVMVLENTIIDSTLNRKISKKHIKIIRDIQKEVKDDKAVINSYFENLSKKKNNIFGAVFK